jgi:ABC-type nitrate/sulfonate/bicarbonate transport system substrate-binding protein
MRIAVPDLVSNSYFPAIAAAELGLFKEQGLDLTLELVAPLDQCAAALKDGHVSFIAASAHAPLLAFPDWEGAKLLCAQAQGTYWFLVMRKDLHVARGDLTALKQRRIAAVPFVGAALRELLKAAGVDPGHENIEIMVPESARKPGVNFGVAVAEGLRDGSIDGFFANGMGAAVAVKEGIGDIVLDVRRGDGPAECFNYTFGAIATTDKVIQDTPDAAAGVIRAIRQAQNMLKADINNATLAARRLYPEREAGLIADIVARDLPYYDPIISAERVQRMNRYTQQIGMLGADVAYEKIVATQYSYLWTKDI